MRIVEALAECPKLLSLNLRETDVGACDCGHALGGALKALTALQDLNLSNNGLADRGVRSLAATLGPLPELRALNLAGNAVRCATLALTALLRCCSTISSLDLSVNGLASPGLGTPAFFLRCVLFVVLTRCSVCVAEHRGSAGAVSRAVGAGLALQPRALRPQEHRPGALARRLSQVRCSSLLPGVCVERLR